MRKSEKITDKVLKVVERIARNDVEKTILGSTAECSALFHQPKRPKKKEKWESKEMQRYRGKRERGRTGGGGGEHQTQMTEKNR